MKEQIKKIKKQEGKVDPHWRVQRGTFDGKKRKKDDVALLSFLSSVWLSGQRAL